MTRRVGVEALCIRCGLGFAAGGRCPHCADLHVLVAPQDVRHPRAEEWSFEIWRAAPDRPAEPLFAVRGFATAGEALSRAHELVRRYVERRVTHD